MLKASFPKEYRQILTMAYYLVSQGGPLSHCGTWCKSHAHPFDVPLTSQCITEILRTISIDGKQTFFNKWMKKVLEDDYLCYDITSISYSVYNELFYNISTHLFTQDRICPCQLTFALTDKIELDVFFLIRFFLTDKIWRKVLFLELNSIFNSYSSDLFKESST